MNDKLIRLEEDAKWIDAQFDKTTALILGLGPKNIKEWKQEILAEQWPERYERELDRRFETISVIARGQGIKLPENLDEQIIHRAVATPNSRKDLVEEILTSLVTRGILPDWVNGVQFNVEFRNGSRIACERILAEDKKSQAATRMDFLAVWTKPMSRKQMIRQRRLSKRLSETRQEQYAPKH